MLTIENGSFNEWPPPHRVSTRFWEMSTWCWEMSTRFWEMSTQFWEMSTRFWEMSTWLWEMSTRFWEMSSRVWEIEFLNENRPQTECLLYSLQSTVQGLEKMNFSTRTSASVCNVNLRQSHTRATGRFPEKKEGWLTAQSSPSRWCWWPWRRGCPGCQTGARSAAQSWEPANPITLSPRVGGGGEVAKSVF